MFKALNHLHFCFSFALRSNHSELEGTVNNNITSCSHSQCIDSQNKKIKKLKKKDMRKKDRRINASGKTRDLCK